MLVCDLYLEEMGFFAAFALLLGLRSVKASFGLSVRSGFYCSCSSLGARDSHTVGRKSPLILTGIYERPSEKTEIV